MLQPSGMVWYRLAPPGAAGHGIACDEHGAWAGAVPLMCRNGGSWAPRPAAEIGEDLADAYGLPIDFGSKQRGLDVVAKALNAGNVALAQAAMLQLHLPDPPPLAKGARSDEEIASLLVELYFSGLLPAEWAEKVARFDPALHPRWPRGDERGGEFRPKDDDLLLPVGDPQDPEGTDRGKRPTRTEEASPELPKDRPPTRGELNTYARSQSKLYAAQVKSGAKTKAEAVAEFLQRAGVPDMLGDIFHRFLTRFDPPLALDELIEQTQTDALRKHAGYEMHHIVEQGPNAGVFSTEQLESPQNVVRIPYYRHRDISDYYSTKQDELGDQTPRDYLRGKSFKEQYEFGLGVLRKFEVIK